MGTLKKHEQLYTLKDGFIIETYRDFVINGLPWMLGKHILEVAKKGMGMRLEEKYEPKSLEGK